MSFPIPVKQYIHNIDNTKASKIGISIFQRHCCVFISQEKQKYILLFNYYKYFLLLLAEQL